MSARRVRVAVVVDNPGRDLPGQVLLAAALARRGVVTYLVPMRRQYSELAALQPDAVVLNYLRSSNSDIASALVEARVATFVLDTEGGVLPSVDHYERTLVAEGPLRRGLAAYLAWGRVLAQSAVERGWFRSDQVVVTGSPRFDFYAAELRRSALALLPAADDDRVTVLVNGNFPVANPRFGSPENEARTLVERDGHPPDWVDRLQRGQAAAMVALTQVVSALGTRHPDLRIVYRPHPFERLETYDSLLPATHNVVVTNAGTADGWILRSVAVIQRGCTTAIEANLAGTPALSPLWVAPAVDMPTAEAVSIPCNDLDELAQSVDLAAQGRLAIPPHVRHAATEVVGDWFHAIDGHAAERVADAIVDRLPDAAPRLGWPTLASVVSAPATRRTAARVAAGFALSPAVSQRIRSADVRSSLRGKWFTADDVRRVAAALELAGRAPMAVTAAATPVDYPRSFRFGTAVRVEATA